MAQLLRDQYELVRSTRSLVLDFLAGLPADVLHRPVAGFGQGTLLSTHLHVADDYGFWFDSVVRGRKAPEFPSIPDAELDVQALRRTFAVADGLVAEFLDAYGERWSEPLPLVVPWRAKPLHLSPLFLMTHEETHEFHHKGQMLSMARILGYPPPDTDALGGLRFP
jgi:uncharacterized damage-inducible protein DinB